MKNHLKPLSELIEGWPSEAPQWLDELAEIKFDELKATLSSIDEELRQLIFELRSHALDIKQGAVREAPLSNPEAVCKALRSGQLRPPENKWIVYPLDKRRRRIPALHKTRGSRFANSISPKVPSSHDLDPVEHGGGYLLVWGGAADVLEIPGVMARLQNLKNEVELFDVVFFERTSGRVTSLRLGVGDEHGRAVETIEPAIAEEGRNLWLS